MINNWLIDSQVQNPTKHYNTKIMWKSVLLNHSWELAWVCSWITGFKRKYNASDRKGFFGERKISGSVPHILKLCPLGRQTWGKNQISNLNKDVIRLPASFCKCLFPRISCLPQIRNQTQNNRCHPSIFNASIFLLLHPLSWPFCFSFVSVFQVSQGHLYFLQSPLHLPHTLLRVCLFLDLWRSEYKVNGSSGAAGGTTHWWVDWFQAEEIICEFFILYPETLLSGDPHIARHQCPWRSEMLYACRCQTCCQIR